MKITYGSKAELLAIELRQNNDVGGWTDIGAVAKKIKEFDPDGSKALALAKKYSGDTEPEK